MFDNKNKNSKEKYLIGDVQKILESGVIDDINIYQLKIDLHDNYDFDLKLENQNYPLSSWLNFYDLEHRYDYKNMPANKKLMALLQIKKDYNIKSNIRLNKLDEIAKELDLKNSIVKDELLPEFFKKYQEHNPDMLTPELILKKDWPMEIKKTAFSSLPMFYKTERNKKIIFDAVEINSLIDKANTKDDFVNIKNKMLNYTNMLLPEFGRNGDNPKIKSLKEKIDSINTNNAKDLLSEIYDTTKDVTITYGDELTKKLSEKIGKDDKIVENLQRYIIGEENEMPDSIKSDHDLETFVRCNREAFLKVKKKDKNFIDTVIGGTWYILFGYVRIYVAYIYLIMALSNLIGASAFLVVPLAALATAVGISVLALCILGIKKLLPIIFKSKFPDRQAAIKSKELADQIRNMVKEEESKNPEFKKKVNDLENKIKNLQEKIKNSNVIQNNKHQQQNLSSFLGLNYDENIYKIKILQKEKLELVNKSNNLLEEYKQLKSKIDNIPKNELEPIFRLVGNAINEIFSKDKESDKIIKLGNEIKKIQEDIKTKEKEIKNLSSNKNNIEIKKDKAKDAIDKKTSKNINDIKPKKRSSSVNLNKNLKSLAEIKVMKTMSENKVIQKNSDENKIHKNNVLKIENDNHL